MSMEWDDEFAIAKQKFTGGPGFQWDDDGFSPAQVVEASARKRRPPAETDFFRSFLSTTRDEHRTKLSEATKSMRDANISQRISSAHSSGTEGQEEKEERQKESATRTYLDFLLNKRQQTARERMKELKEYGYKIPAGRGHLSFLEEKAGDKRQSGRPYSFPLGADRSVQEESFLRDMSTFDSQTGSGYGGGLSSILAEGEINWDSPEKKVDISALLNEDWDKSIRSTTPGQPGRDKSPTSTKRVNILRGQSFPQKEASDRRRLGRPYSFPLGADRSAPQDSFLRDISTFDSQGGSGYDNELSSILAEGQIKWDSPEKKVDISALLNQDWDKSIRSTPGKSGEKDRFLREPSYLKDLADLKGSHAKASYKDELNAILDEGKAEREGWERGQDQEGPDKSFVEMLENMKDNPDKGFEYLINDVYYPGVIDDAVNGKVDFNKLAFMIAFNDGKIPDELPPPDRQPISLAEAFDRRCEKHQGAIKKTMMQPTKGTSLGEKASPGTTDEDDVSRETSKSSIYGLLPRKATLTRILNREELVLASTVGIDVSTIVQNRPVNELIKAMNSLQKAEYMNDYDKSSQAAEEAFKRAPPELAESAAIYGAKNFRTIELSRKGATIKQDLGYKPIEVVSYMGITKPMADVKILD